MQFIPFGGVLEFRSETPRSLDECAKGGDKKVVSFVVNYSVSDMIAAVRRLKTRAGKAHSEPVVQSRTHNVRLTIVPLLQWYKYPGKIVS